MVYYCARSGRRVALSNLDLAYGDSLTKKEKVQIAKGSYSNLVTTGLELCYTPHLPRPIDSVLTVRGKEHYFRAVEEGKGVILLVPHMGNWEACGRWLIENTPVVHAVSRRQKQPWLAQVTNEVRSQIGIREIDNRQALRPVLAALRRGETVILMIDQHMRKGVVEVQFFGHPAMTSASAALLAVRAGCRVLVGACYRFPDGSWGGTFSPPLETTHTGDRHSDYVVNTQRYVSAIEGYVREHPADWMWMHRRWKNLESRNRES